MVQEQFEMWDEHALRSDPINVTEVFRGLGLGIRI